MQAVFGAEFFRVQHPVMIGHRPVLGGKTLVMRNPFAVILDRIVGILIVRFFRFHTTVGCSWHSGMGAGAGGDMLRDPEGADVFCIAFP